MFCRDNGLNRSHVRAVRELIENTVVAELGQDRIEDFWDGKDDADVRAVVDGVCRDFAGLHGMPETSRMGEMVDISKNLRILMMSRDFKQLHGVSVLG